MVDIESNLYHYYNSVFNVSNNHKNANGKLITDILLILGYVTSGDPIFIGSNTLTITIQTM